MKTFESISRPFYNQAKHSNKNTWNNKRRYLK
ncbi:hypothetical protein DET49_10684 [Salegentibacter sp. 24]|nr:hypothetical protein DET49_10684 [Salegentibacter sp. 24]